MNRYMESKPYKFLFLCTGNSARSIFGEYLLRQLGGSRFQVFSAGSFPTGKVNPLAIQVLKDVYNIDASEARSKSWEEFNDIEFDFVVTVCDNARETCPIWPGQPIVAHWSSPDPAAVEGTMQKSIVHLRKWLSRSIAGSDYLHRFHWTIWTGSNWLLPSGDRIKMNCENITVTDASPDDLRAFWSYSLRSSCRTMESRKTSAVFSLSETNRHDLSPRSDWNDMAIPHY